MAGVKGSKVVDHVLEQKDNNLHCKICNKDFLTPGGHGSHMYRLHENPKPSKPVPNGPIGKRKRDISGKIKSENRFKFKCKVCGDGFHRISGFQSHMRSHKLRQALQNKDIQYLCKICGLEFSTKTFLTNHAKIHNTNKYAGEKHIVCDICGERFLEMSHLIIHKRTHTGEKPYKCNSCEMCFYSKGRLCNHIRWKHSDTLKKFKCELCKKRFHFKSLLEQHKKVHTNETYFECEICSKKFKGKAGYDSHLKSHTGENLFTCKICGNNYLNKNSLKSHMNRHTKEKIFKCDVCTKVFLCKGNLTKHRRIHFDDKPYQCPVCGKGFKQNSGMHTHMNTHEPAHLKKRKYPLGEKPFKCDVCDQAFSTKSSLASHSRLHTGEMIECEICKKTFINHQRYRIHQRSHTGEFTHTCDVCGRGFTCRENYRRHYNHVHCNIRKWQCDECGKRFTQCAALSRHRRTHTGEKPYPCTVCDKKYGDVGSLQRHMRYHSGEPVNSFLCTICFKGFTRQSGVQLHMNAVHNKSKPYKCNICKKTFAIQQNLKHHLERHAGVRKFKCEYCDKRFLQASELKKHILIVHKNIYPYQCSICSGEFSGSSNMKNHLLTHVQTPKKKNLMEPLNECSICQKEFSSKSNLKRHKRLHGKGKNDFKEKLLEKNPEDDKFECCVCHKDFGSETNLRTHIITHAFEMKKDKTNSHEDCKDNIVMIEEQEDDATEARNSTEEHTNIFDIMKNCTVVEKEEPLSDDDIIFSSHSSYQSRAEEGFCAEVEVLQHGKEKPNQDIHPRSDNKRKNLKSEIKEQEINQESQKDSMIQENKSANDNKSISVNVQSDQSYTGDVENMTGHTIGGGRQVTNHHSVQKVNKHTNIFDNILKKEVDKKTDDAMIQDSESSVVTSSERREIIDLQVSNFHSILKRRKKKHSVPSIGTEEDTSLTSDEASHDVSMTSDDASPAKPKRDKNIFDEMIKSNEDQKKNVMLLNGMHKTTENKYGNVKIDISSGLSNIFNKMLHNKHKESSKTVTEKQCVKEDLLVKERKTFDGRKNIFDELIKYNASLRNKELDGSEIVILDDSDESLVQSPVKTKQLEIVLTDKNTGISKNNENNDISEGNEEAGSQICSETNNENGISCPTQTTIEDLDNSSKDLVNEHEQNRLEQKGINLSEKRNSDESLETNSIHEELEESESLNEEQESIEIPNEEEESTESPNEEEITVENAECTCNDKEQTSFKQSHDSCVNDPKHPHSKNDIAVHFIGNDKCAISSDLKEQKLQDNMEYTLDQQSEYESQTLEENLSDKKTDHLQVQTFSNGKNDSSHCLASENKSCLNNPYHIEEKTVSFKKDENLQSDQGNHDSITADHIKMDENDGGSELITNDQILHLMRDRTSLYQSGEQHEEKVLPSTGDGEPQAEKGVNARKFPKSHRIGPKHMHLKKIKRSGLNTNSCQNSDTLVETQNQTKEKLDADMTKEVKSEPGAELTKENVEQVKPKSDRKRMYIVGKKLILGRFHERKQSLEKQKVSENNEKFPYKNRQNDIVKQEPCMPEDNKGLDNSTKIIKVKEQFFRKDSERFDIKQESIETNIFKSPEETNSFKMKSSRTFSKNLRVCTKVEPSSPELFSCDICEQTFKTKKSLRTHKLSHNDRYLFSCQACGKGFSWEDHLERHMNIHLKSSTYVDLLKTYSTI